MEWADGGGPISSSVEIPVTPTKADSSTAVGPKVGLTLDGVVIDGSGPIDLILGNYAIGVFDDCGGHETADAGVGGGPGGPGGGGPPPGQG